MDAQIWKFTGNGETARGPFAEEPNPGQGQAAESGRRKIWQTEQYFHCPVAGMCLTLDEQRRLSAKADPKAAGRGDFFVHECVVANLGWENAMSRKADALLARKYGDRGRKLLRMSEDEFLRHWRVALKRGDFAAELWAAAVRRDMSQSGRVEVFGSSHVAFHELSKERLAHETLLRRQADKLDVLKGMLGQARQDRRRQEAEAGSLLRRLAESEAALALARALSGERSGGVQAGFPEEARARIAELEGAAGRLAGELERRDGEIAELRARVRELEAGSFSAQESDGEPSCPRAAACAAQGCTPDCPSFDLCRKRVLIVGGPGRMEDVYRRFVEERGGVFEYHDGRLHGGARELESRFRRADVVLCPVNCNSHGACLLLKNLGKKHGKPVHMLPGFGLGTVSRAMAAGAN